jgi:pimeloyl-ACP methyl ester carboxylesterase
MDHAYKRIRVGNSGLSVGYIHRSGSGRRIVLVHGIGTHSGSWTKLINALPKELDIYAVDLLGHGTSTTPKNFGISVQLRALGGFISRLGLSDFYLFGHSYGGWLSAIYASKNEEVRGLILEDTSGLKSHFEDIMMSGARERHIETVVEKSRGAYGVRTSAVRSAMKSVFRGGHLTEDVLDKIRCRTLIIWGADDAWIPIRYGRVFHRHIRGSAFRTIGGAKHTPHYTHPRIVSRLVRRFIDG